MTLLNRQAGPSLTEEVNVYLVALSLVPGPLTEGEHSDPTIYLGGDPASPAAKQFARSRRNRENASVRPSFVLHSFRSHANFYALFLNTDTPPWFFLFVLCKFSLSASHLKGEQADLAT